MKVEHNKNKITYIVCIIIPWPLSVYYTELYSLIHTIYCVALQLNIFLENKITFYSL
jgi:hypothetical protein